ncbi:hypothetical protein DPM19_00560 [Actinomadura craniellae]|uniref:HlyC/CorC family transporter n=1 Tax=Actinomadura craniellae TaxID=2231787 RepID=A0A365HCH9_9ACTN|nr:hemolysin family protein [Actinomadura craniellae]RAY16712.1 hypothetical protein DPM19_00560 [Actinomadura craniellae]
MTSALLGIVAVLVLTVATGYFVAQEFAYTTADRAVLSAQAEQGDVRARRALQVMARLSFMLSGAQLGITVTALVVGFIAEPALAQLLEPLLTGLGVAGAGPISVAVGFALATVVQMVLGELAPKNWAIARPEPLARMLAASTLAYLTVAGPVVRLFDASANRLLRRVGVEPVEELHHGATLEELSDIIGESGRSGHLPPDLTQLLDRALTFGEHSADEVMVPRPKVVTTTADTTVTELLKIITRTGHSNYPVLGQEIDEVVGVVGARELAAARAAGPAAPFEELTVGPLARPALLVPATLPLHTLVQRMHEAREEFICVVDEYGGLAGIVTFEDVAEELVGEITDENDPAPALTARTETGWEVDAGLRIDEINQATGAALPEGEHYDTLAGLIMVALGRMAAVGDTVTVPQDPDSMPVDARPGTVETEVLALRRRVPARARLRVRPAPEPAAAGTEEERWTR